MSQFDKQLTQPLAEKAIIKLHNLAFCFTCFMFFNWLHQTKHGTCPECNQSNWVTIKADDAYFALETVAWRERRAQFQENQVGTTSK
jgi:hypothetical protein